jgi:hypothetical protein
MQRDNDEPVVPPVERAIANIGKAAYFADWKCPHCHATQTAIGARDGLVVAVSVEHEIGCPDYVSWD